MTRTAKLTALLWAVCVGGIVFMGLRLRDAELRAARAQETVLRSYSVSRDCLAVMHVCAREMYQCSHIAYGQWPPVALARSER